MNTSLSRLQDHLTKAKNIIAELEKLMEYSGYWVPELGFMRETIITDNNRACEKFTVELREAHMWYVIPDEIKGTSLLEQYLEILSPSEKQTVLSLKDDELRKRAILARTLVRTTIARYQTNPTIDPRSLSFKKNSYGKPEIGIDVEEKKRIVKNDVMSFARRFFCRHEVEHLANISDPVKRRQEFMKLWTLKESYVKALGRGFSATPFNTFRISCKASFISVSDVPYIASSKVPEIVESTYIAHKWQFALMELANTHYASICIEKDTGFEETEESPMMVRVWKTIPFLGDLCVSGTPSVATVGLVE
ncbi:hypothetical protein Cgig2_012281 [Carnegiea gigantea]|uniref:holo-[acyl-carrier-protein] synthase n=1 Tax=Carnegiea gigantea TaxID=171969 RepID=A0A9Q1GLY2_9CARY|nr:hypothetical protein Cgig2_012281 [Carnegiea gigantea]